MPNLKAVQGTNDWSIVSKLSAVAGGYWSDQFLPAMVHRAKRRASLVNLGYYLRFKSLEVTFEKLVKLLVKEEKPFQVLSIGCGFDTTFFNLAKYGNNLKYYEIDLLDNVSRKTILIQRSFECNEFLIKPEFHAEGITSQRYNLLACDLSNPSELKAKLSSVNFDFLIPTIVLSECVITYMREKDSTNLIKFFSTELHHASFVVYEQINPEDGFGKFMVSHFEKMGSPILGIEKYSSVSRQCSRYLDCGWQQCEALTLANVFRNISSTELQRIFGIEAFDEYEEFLLAACHYLVVVAVQGSLTRHLPALRLNPATAPPPPVLQLRMEPVLLGKKQEVFGQGAVSEGGLVYLVGGFGPGEGGGHHRLGRVVGWLLGSGGGPAPLLETQHPVLARMFPAVSLHGGRLLVSGGRHGPSAGLTDIVVVDCETGAVTELKWRLAEPCWRHCSALLADHLVLVGGRGSAGELVRALNLSTGTWLPPVPLPAGAVHSASAAVWGDTVVVTGGWGAAGPVGTVTLVSLTAAGLAARLARLELEPRSGHTSHVTGDLLVVVGGAGWTGHSSLQVVDLVTGRARCNTLPAGPPLLLPHNHASALLGSTLFLLAGGGNCFSFGTHYNQPVRLDLSALLS